jgi:hypothetical protein
MTDTAFTEEQKQRAEAIRIAHDIGCVNAQEKIRLAWFIVYGNDVHSDRIMQSLHIDPKMDPEDIEAKFREKTVRHAL